MYIPPPPATSPQFMLCSIVMALAVGPVNKAHTLDRCTAYNLQSPSVSVSGSYDALYKLLSVKDLWGKQLGWVTGVPGQHLHLGLICYKSTTF